MTWGRGLSICSGIGGLDLAAEWAGIEPVAFCEIEPFCQKVLKKHWTDVHIFDDIFKLSAKELEVMPNGARRESIDIIYGGFP